MTMTPHLYGLYWLIRRQRLASKNENGMAILGIIHKKKSESDQKIEA
jgi:hypothetical protein